MNSEKKELGSEPSSDHLKEDFNMNRLRELEEIKIDVRASLNEFQSVNRMYRLSNKSRRQWFPYLTEHIRLVTKDCNKSPKEELLIIREVLKPLHLLVIDVNSWLKPTHKKTKEKLDHEGFTLQLIINHIESLINGYSEEDQK